MRQDLCMTTAMGFMELYVRRSGHARCRNETPRPQGAHNQVASCVRNPRTCALQEGGKLSQEFFHLVSGFFEMTRAAPRPPRREMTTVIPHLMHTSLDVLPHLMHTKSGNQLGSYVKIIKFKRCMHIHLMHTEKLPNPMLYFAWYRFSLVNTKGTDTVMLSSYLRHVWHRAHVAHLYVMIRYNKPHLMHKLTWCIRNWSTDDMHQVRYYLLYCNSPL